MKEIHSTAATTTSLGHARVKHCGDVTLPKPFHPRTRVATAIATSTVLVHGCWKRYKATFQLGLKSVLSCKSTVVGRGAKQLSGWAWARSPRLLEEVQSNFQVGLKEGAVVRGGPRLLEEVQTNFQVGLEEGAVVRGGPRLLEDVQTNFPVGLEEEQLCVEVHGCWKRCKPTFRLGWKRSKASFQLD